MPQEIYIAIRDGTGDGSRLDPFNGSTDATLDAILLGAGEKPPSTLDRACFAPRDSAAVNPSLPCGVGNAGSAPGSTRRFCNSSRPRLLP